MLAALALAACLQQSPSLDLSKQVGKTYKVWEKNDANTRALFKAIEDSEPKENRFGRIPSWIKVLQVHDEYLAIADIDHGIVTTLGSPQQLYFCWFSRDQKFETGFRFMPDIRADKICIVPLPEISDFVLKIGGTGSTGSEAQYVGFVNRRPASIQLESDSPVTFDYGYVYTPPFPAYNEKSVTEALKSQSNVEVLEALQWLSENHRTPSLKTSSFVEPFADMLRYWQDLYSPEVRSQLKLLAVSDQKWIASAAQKALAIVKPESPAMSAADRISAQRVEDLRVGPGTEWQTKNRTLSAGDEGLFFIEAKLPDGRPVGQDESSRSLTPIHVGSPYLIKGLAGLAGMRPGGERRLTLPASMAYGEVGADEIPPGSGLIVDAKLVYIDNIRHPETRLKIHDMQLGTGKEAKTGDYADFTWTCETLDGKAIKDLQGKQPVSNRYLMSGVSRAVIGMKPGGTRRALLDEGVVRGEAAFDLNRRIVVQIKLTSVRPGPRSAR